MKGIQKNDFCSCEEIWLKNPRFVERHKHQDSGSTRNPTQNELKEVQAQTSKLLKTKDKEKKS